MKKIALYYTSLFILIPTILVFLLNYILTFLKNDPNFSEYCYFKDFVIIFFSAIATFVIILRNNSKNRTIFQKIKQNNEATRISNERFEIVAKATSDTIWDRNLITNNILWNKGIQEIFGYSEEASNTTYEWWFGKIHPEDQLRMSVFLYNLIEQKTQRWDNQYRFLCADGSYKYILDRGFLVTNVNEIPVRMIGAMQDISKQKIEELRLKLLEKVITETKDAIIITESNQNERKIPKVVYVNPAFTTITGYEAKDVINKSAKVFIKKEAIATDFNKLSIALKTKNEFQFESFNTQKNGQKYWVNFSIIPISNSDGEHSHWIAILREITDQKKKEKEKEQLIKELIKNNSDLKQFSYITSHNLRAPLSNLAGLLQLLDDIEINDPELIEILNGFKVSTNMLKETIDDLTKVIVIKDSPSIAKEEVQLTPIFEKIQIQLNAQIAVSNPTFSTNFDDAPYILTNKTYLESILFNLLSNSLKYKSEKRNLTIKVTATQTQELYFLTFEDNGIGIDLELNGEKIFGLYQRFHDHPESKGLGLYLIKSQIESLGGTIKVESRLDKGTKFTITFIKKLQNNA